MFKKKASVCIYEPGPAARINEQMTRGEKLAVVLFLFVLLMALGYCIASIYGYVELQLGLA